MSCNCEGKTINIGMGCCQPVLAPIENYYTKYQVDDIIEGLEISGGCCITEAEVDEKIASAKTEIEQEIPSLSGYATEAFVSAYTYDKETIDEKVAGGGTFDPTQYYTTGQTYSKNEVDTALSGKADVSDTTSINNALTAHTSNNSIHVTTADKNIWNAKPNVWCGTEQQWAQISGSTESGTIYLVY